MTLVQSPPAPPHSQQQQFLNGIAVRLAQLAKDPPDLLVYLRVHAECVTGAVSPVGFAYEMQSNSGFQRVLQGNLESLGYKDSPEQENALQRARSLAADQKKPLLLPPQTRQSSGNQGLPATDSPAPDELAVFNHTPYEQIFVPILLGDTTAGILHIWCQPTNTSASQARLALLRQLCGEAELYLRNRRSREVSHELTRLTTYAQLLEELTGDIDLDSISWKLVNYAREAVACERVCMFIATDYDRAVKSHAPSGELEYKFQLQACSGLKRPHPRSEQAVILQRVAQKLTEMSLNKLPNASSQVANNPSLGTSPSAGTPNLSNGSGERQIVGNAPRTAAEAAKPRVQLTLLMRDPSKTPTRPPEVNEYFDVMPMNWATVIPLFDRAQRVCGILLFEGTKIEEKLGNSFKPMMELAASAGKSLGTTLYCSQNRSMRLARKVVALRQEYVNTPARRKLLRFGLPLLLLLAVLVFPVPYSVKGNASVLPVKQNSVPALISARLLEVSVREGEAVKKGQVLASFDTKDIGFLLGQAEQDYRRSLAEIDSARSAGNEYQMGVARWGAEKAKVTADKLRVDLDRAVVRAPFDGLVLGAQTLSTRVGEVLRIGEPALQVVDPSAWQVKASLKERDLIILDRQLNQKGPVLATLRLSANPAHKYQLTLSAHNQLAYGLDTATGQYEFTAMLPLTDEIDSSNVLKAGFTGQITFAAGMHSLAYFLFKDFADYLTVRFF